MRSRDDSPTACRVGGGHLYCTDHLLGRTQCPAGACAAEISCGRPRHGRDLNPNPNPNIAAARAVPGLDFLRIHEYRQLTIHQPHPASGEAFLTAPLTDDRTRCARRPYGAAASGGRPRHGRDLKYNLNPRRSRGGRTLRSLSGRNLALGNPVRGATSAAMPPSPLQCVSYVNIERIKDYSPTHTWASTKSIHSGSSWTPNGHRPHSHRRTRRTRSLATKRTPQYNTKAPKQCSSHFGGFKHKIAIIFIHKGVMREKFIRFGLGAAPHCDIR